MTNGLESDQAIDSFESARSAVAGGTAPDTAARELVSHMTRRNGCGAWTGMPPHSPAGNFSLRRTDITAPPFSPPSCHDWASRGSPSATGPAAR